MASSANVQAVTNRKFSFKTPVDLRVVYERIAIEKARFRDRDVFAVLQIGLNAAVNHEPIAGIDVAGNRNALSDEQRPRLDPVTEVTG